MFVSKRVLLSLCFALYIFVANAQIFVNECMATNVAFWADEFGEYDDWIEIYNSGNSAVNLSGYYMSDDPSDLTKYQIPTDGGAAVTVPANGYLLLWADNDSEQGAHHLEFKLTSGGESILIVDPDGSTIIDQMSFPNQGSDISYGRFPNGSNNFQFFPLPSPNASNINGGTINIPFDLELPLNLSSDDANEFFGNMGLSKELLNLGQDGTIALSAGLRFTNVGIDKSADIEEAYIQFRSWNDQAAVANYVIQMSSEIFPATHTATQNNITSRPYLSEEVQWNNIPAWTSGADGLDQRTPNLSSLIEAWIAQGNWQSGGSAYFNIEGSGQRDADSFDGNTSGSARLIIKGKVEIPNQSISDLFINEVAAAGTDYLDENDEAEDWVELYNGSNSTINSTGLYLTDDKDDLDKWNLPFGRDIAPGDFITFFMDGETDEGSSHGSFKLQAKDEWLGLVQQTANGFTIIDSLAWDKVPFQATYGRKNDGQSNLQLFGDMTPNASNNSARGYLAPPVIDLESGHYTGSQNTTISHPESGVSIYYTLDGSLPTTNSASYSGSISITENSAVRAIATKSGFAPSQPGDAAFLIDEDINMPALFLTTDPDNFFSDQEGIYVVGTNGIVDGCVFPDPANYAQNWERPANLKLIYPDGMVGFDENVGVKISGACSRNFPMKSLAVNLREQVYGDGKIEHPIFEDRKNDDFFRLKVRNSGQDFSRLGFRDYLNQKLLINKLDVETQAGLPTMLFINGEFWGIHNIREKYKKYYFNENYGIGLNKIDVIKSPGLVYADVKEGSQDEYNELYDWVGSANLANAADFQTFSDQVDINNFINYWSVMIFMANCDWPNNNITVWKEQKAGEKWHWAIADTDCSTEIDFTASQLSYPHFNTLAAVTDPVNNTPPYSFDAVRFLNKAFENQDFHEEYAQRFCSIMDIVYNQDSIDVKFNEVKDLFTPNVPRHIDRWEGVDPAYSAMGGSTFAWEAWANRWRSFYEDRPAFMRQHLEQKFGFNGTYQLNFNVDASTKGKVLVNWNEMEVPFNHSGTYFKNIPLTVKAVADQGFEFIKWEETGITDAEIQYISVGNAMITPIFEAICTAGTACDDGDACTENDVFDNDCGCSGTFADSDSDGVCNADDICEGYDDNIDSDGDGIPDGCDNIAVKELNAIEFNLYPNPSGGTAMIELTTSEEFPSHFDLSNALGQMIPNARFERKGTHLLEVACPDCENGIYILRLENEDGMSGKAQWVIMK